MTTAKRRAPEARWGLLLVELAAYRADGNDLPRHKGFASEEERVLGVWLHVQRISQGEGKLFEEAVRPLTVDELITLELDVEQLGPSATARQLAG